MMLELVGSLIATIYGGCTCFHKKVPLFYRILWYAGLTCLIGNIYTALYVFLWQSEDVSFHIGYLGYIGMFFFLFSSYYGALDSLVDGKQTEFRWFRRTAGFIAGLFLAGSTLLMYFGNQEFWKYLVIVPMTFTMYFAVKHLIMPDIEMGYIRVLRTYNILIIALCICMMLRIVSVQDSVLENISSICIGILLAVYLPVARMGVRKWFIF